MRQDLARRQEVSLQALTRWEVPSKLAVHHPRDERVDQFWRIATYLLLIFAFVWALSNAASFSKASGTLFGSLNNLGGAILSTGRLWHLYP